MPAAPEPPARKATDISGMVLLGLPLAFIALCLVLPLFGLVVFALAELGIAGAYQVTTEPAFIRAIARTIVLAGVTTLGVLVAGTAYSVCLLICARPLRIVLSVILFVNFAVSPLVRTYGWVLLFQPRGALDVLGVRLGLIGDSFGLYQSMAAMYPAMLHAMLPFMVLPLYAGLRAIEPNQLQAARSLGASSWMTLHAVVLPQIRAAATAGSCLVFILSLGFFITPQLLGGPNDVLIATIIYRTFEALIEPAQAAAMSIFALAVIIVLFAISDRLFKVTEAWGTR